MLEHQPISGAQPALPRAWASQILAAGDHGRGHLLCPQRGPVPLASGEEVRHTVPDIRVVRKPGPQYAWAERGWRCRYVHDFVTFELVLPIVNFEYELSGCFLSKLELI